MADIAITTYNITNEPYPVERKLLPVWEIILKLSIGSLLILFSLIGNALIIIIVLRDRRMRTVTNYYIVNLAVADLMVTTSCTWVHLVIDISEDWILGDFFCKFNSFAQVTSLVSSVLTLSLIAYDRFFGIVFALKAHITDRKACWSLVLVWGAAMAVGSPFIIYRRIFSYQWSDHLEIWCGDEWPLVKYFDAVKNETVVSIPSRATYYTAVSVVLYFIPMTIMLFAYSFIIYRLRVKEMPGELLKKEAAAQAKIRRRVIVMLVVLLAVFAICWLPYQIILLYAEHRTDKTKTLDDWYYKFRFFALFLAYSNSAVNPPIYAWGNENFRKGFRDFLASIRCKKDYYPVDGAMEMTSHLNTTMISKE